MGSAPRRLEVAAFALAAGLVIGNALVQPPRMLGDGAEYFLVADALARHASPDLRPGDGETTAARFAREGVDTKGALAEVPLVEGRDGRLYTIHFWGYPLATLAVRPVLNALGLGPLRAPQVANALLFGASLGAILFQSPLPDLARRTYAALTFLSPALWFVAWPHPEVFSFSLTTIALVWRAAGWPGPAVLAAALASVQNPPLVVLAAWLAAQRLGGALRAGRAGRRPLAVGTALALVPAAIPAAFSLWAFGTPSVLTRGAVDASNLSAARALELLLDLNLGLLPHAPVVLGVCLVGALVSPALRPGVALAFALAFVSTAAVNWNSGTSGPARYTVWIYPLLLDGFAKLLAGPDHHKELA